MSSTNCLLPQGLGVSRDRGSSTWFVPRQTTAGQCVVCGEPLLAEATTQVGEPACPFCRCSVRWIETLGPEGHVLFVQLPRRFRFPVGRQSWFRQLLAAEASLPLVVLDVSRVAALSALAARLAQLAQAIRQRGGQLRLVGSLCGRQRQVLALLGLDHQLPIYPDLEQALAGD